MTSILKLLATIIGPNSNYDTVFDVSDYLELHPDSSGKMIVHQQIGSGHG